MARKTHRKTLPPTTLPLPNTTPPPPTTLLDLPNEVVIEVASYLRIPDLRRLSRVNHKFYFFVSDYLARYRYGSGLSALPDELILRIVECLGSQKDCSRLARTSHRFYPLVMSCILRHNIQHGESDLLYYAASKNLKTMARAMIRLGANVNTSVKCNNFAFTSLVAAASFSGDEEMVEMLLDAGASQFTYKKRIALTVAILKRKMKVALVLSRDLESPDEPLDGERGSALQLACRRRIVDLVRNYVKREGPVEIEGRSIALYNLLQQYTSRADIVKNELHEDVYQIALLLLHHGADPDLHLHIKGSGFTNADTARALASRNPDPRIRGLLPISSLRSSRPASSKIGRSWMDQSASQGSDTFGSISFDCPKHAKLGDLFDFSDVEESNPELLPTRITISDSTPTSLSEEVRILPPFPQLGTSKESLHPAANSFWAKSPATVFQQGEPVHAAVYHTSTDNKKKKEQLEKTEAFPKLVKLSTASSNDGGKALWAGFSQKATSPKPKTSQHEQPPVTTTDAGTEATPGPKTSRKKKKWEPLRL
ncbi:hypothetical protein CC80DRAFT_493891 [Byssothecium circinans]|uniref:F-box domain-containing protein n=1 Tax=Byssothecium circinans TaxID=147558 RepID=A0A6A5TPT6_9PLEO|nr:hypothetical protein CC80DRAFT_493891 [Byssothecium circinans]